MEKVRKFCAVFFGCLAVFFALIAVRNHFYKGDCLDSSAMLPWNAETPAKAARAGRLVFVHAADLSELSPECVRILNKKYSVARLDKNLNPADYDVLTYFLRRKLGRDSRFACAVFTPTFKPVYIASDFDAKKIAAVLEIFACSFDSAPEKFNLRAERAGRDLARSAVFGVAETAPFPFANAAFSSEKIADACPTALLTENARVRFADARKSVAMLTRIRAAEAFATLKRQFAKRADARDRLYIARALADARFAVSAEAVPELDCAAKSALQDASQERAADAALKLSVLCGAYSVFENAQYLAGARRIAARLVRIASERRDIPAVVVLSAGAGGSAVVPNSIASALDLSLMANALCDYFDIARDASALSAARALLGKLDSDYRFGGLWTINSAFSPTASFARFAVLDDAADPSYVGEAKQAFVRVGRRSGAQSADIGGGSETALLSSVGFRTAGRASSMLAELVR